MSATTMRFRIESLDIHEGPRSTVWYSNGQHVAAPDLEGCTNDRTAAVTVELDVDGQFDIAYLHDGPYGDVESLGRFIATLTKIREALIDGYGTRGVPAGRCFAMGDWGVCIRDSGHTEKHRFPAPPKGYPGYEDAKEIEKAVTEIWEGSPV